MPPFRSILHPTDLTARGHAAFAHALRLSLACKSRFSIVHSEKLNVDDEPVWDSFPAVRSTLTSWGLLPEDAPRSADAVLKSMGASFPQFAGMTLGKLGPLGLELREPVTAEESAE